MLHVRAASGPASPTDLDVYRCTATTVLTRYALLCGLRNVELRRRYTVGL